MQRKYEKVVCWDWDGPLNDINYSLDQGRLPLKGDVDITNKEMIQLVLEILEENNVLSVIASQRITYDKPEEAHLKNAILTELNNAFGANRLYLTETHANQLNAKLAGEGEATGHSKNIILNAIKDLEACENISNENIILVDDLIDYEKPAIEEGFKFIYASRDDDKTSFKDRKYLGQVLLATIPIDKLRKDLENSARNKNTRSELLQVINDCQTFEAEFEQQLTATLTRDFAQKKITLALEDTSNEGELSRIFDKMAFSRQANQLTFEKVKKMSPQELTEHLNHFLKNIAAIMLNRRRQAFLPSIQDAIGNYDALKNKYTEDSLIQRMIQASFTLYSLAISEGCDQSFNVEKDENGFCADLNKIQEAQMNEKEKLLNLIKVFSRAITTQGIKEGREIVINNIQDFATWQFKESEQDNKNVLQQSLLLRYTEYFGLGLLLVLTTLGTGFGIALTLTGIFAPFGVGLLGITAIATLGALAATSIGGIALTAGLALYDKTSKISSGTSYGIINNIIGAKLNSNTNLDLNAPDTDDNYSVNSVSNIVKPSSQSEQASSIKNPQKDPQNANSAPQSQRMQIF